MGIIYKRLVCFITHFRFFKSHVSLRMISKTSCEIKPFVSLNLLLNLLWDFQGHLQQDDFFFLKTSVFLFLEKILKQNIKSWIESIFNILSIIVTSLGHFVVVHHCYDCKNTSLKYLFITLGQKLKFSSKKQLESVNLLRSICVSYVLCTS